MTPIALFRDQACRRPSQPAVIAGGPGGQELTSFAALAAGAGAVAGQLAARGVGPGDRLLMLGPPSVATYRMLFGCWWAGVTVILPDQEAGWTATRAMVERLTPKACAAPGWLAALVPFLPGLRQIPVVCRLGIGRAEPGGPIPEPISAALDQPALITATRAANGIAKLIECTHGELSAQLAAIRALQNGRPGSAVLTDLPAFVIGNCIAGLTSVLPRRLSRPDRVDRDSLRRLVICHRVEQAILAPAAAARLAAGPADDPALKSVREIFLGGGPVFPDLIDALARTMPGAAAVVVYGASEAEPITAIPAERLSAKVRALIAAGAGLPVGSPLPAMAVAVIQDRTGQPIPALDESAFHALARPGGAIGEIVVAGPWVLDRSLGGEDNRECKIMVGDRTWHRTGDAGWRDRSGNLWLVGRAGSRLPGVEPLYPLQIEAALRSRSPGLRAAILAPNAPDGAIVIAADRACPPDLPPRLAALAAAARWRRMAALPMDHRHGSRIDEPALRRRLGLA